MVLACEIIFDQNVHGVYFAGQMLSGRVAIRLDKPKKLNGVRIQMAGQAKTRWNECVHRFVDGRPEKKEVFYQADETFLDSKAYLRKGTDNDADAASDTIIELPAGQHLYTFACSLPPMLPTSFEGQFGHIRYTVKVVLERPWNFDQTYKVAFTVLNELDLNLLSPILRIPTQMESANSFWCGPCTSGQLTIAAHIPQSGYVPGQNIAIAAVVTNMSNINVEYMRFSLRKVVLYKSQVPSTKTKLELDVVQERRSCGVPKKTQRTFEVVVAIPPIPPTNTNLCKVIEIAYEVKVEAKIRGPHSNPYVVMPVTIGTVPLNRNAPDPKTPSIRTAPAPPICEQPSPTQPDRTIVERLAAPPLYTNEAAAALGSADTGLASTEDISAAAVPAPAATTDVQPIMLPLLATATHEQLNNIPPPSYEESLRGNHNIADDDDAQQLPIGVLPYTPRYVVYNFDALQQRRVQANDSQPQGSAVFTMALPEAKRNVYRALDIAVDGENRAEVQTGVESSATVTVTLGTADVDRTVAENERHAAKLRANMAEWT